MYQPKLDLTFSVLSIFREGFARALVIDFEISIAIRVLIDSASKELSIGGHIVFILV